MPAFDRIARKVRPGTQRVRRRQRPRRIAQSLHPSPERRKYPQAPAFLVTDIGGSCQKVAGEALRGDANLLQRCGDLAGRGLMRCLRNLVPEHRAGRNIETGPQVMRTTSRTSAESAGGYFEPVRCSLSRNADCPHPDRFSASGDGRQGLLHRAGWRHAGRHQARAGDPVLSALWGRHPDFCERAGRCDLAIGAALRALFGLFCYATFELTSLSLLKHWTWPVVVVDISWGIIVTALSSTAGLLIANRIAPRI